MSYNSEKILNFDRNHVKDNYRLQLNELVRKEKEIMIGKVVPYLLKKKPELSDELADVYKRQVWKSGMTDTILAILISIAHGMWWTIFWSYNIIRKQSLWAIGKIPATMQLSGHLLTCLLYTSRADVDVSNFSKASASSKMVSVTLTKSCLLYTSWSRLHPQYFPRAEAEHTRFRESELDLFRMYWIPKYMMRSLLLKMTTHLQVENFLQNMKVYWLSLIHIWSFDDWLKVE